MIRQLMRGRGSNPRASASLHFLILNPYIIANWGRTHTLTQELMDMVLFFSVNLMAIKEMAPFGRVDGTLLSPPSAGMC
jgi:hypothetical protein